MAEEKLVILQPGEEVGQWTITKKLGAGAFGAVYLCRNSRSRLEAALKTEPLDANPPLLAMEALVLRELHRLRDGRHFTACHDLGRQDATDQQGKPFSFNYIVMALVGKSLDNLVKARPGNKFSPGTAIGIAIQMVDALRALHSIGYLHRDIKPANTTIGRVEQQELRVIYLLDFGMARKYQRDDGTMRRPRPNANFRGSPRYAAISAHIGREYSRKDDIESMFYMIVELYCGSLPWSGTADMARIGELKQRRSKEKPPEMRQKAVQDLINQCPPVFTEILKHVDLLKYYTRPDYRWLMKILKDHLIKSNIPEHPYDWEPGAVDPYFT